MSRVALISENSVEYVDKLLDIWNNGDCAVLLDWRIPFKTSYQMMLEAGVQKCFIESRLIENIALSEYSEVSFMTFDIDSCKPSLMPECIREKYNENMNRDEAVVLYSSGTTGKSKGVILSHYAITVNADAIIEYMTPSKDDCIYTIRPFSHSSTLTGELLVSLRSKCNLLISPTIIPPRYVFNNVQKYHVTILCINPLLLSMLCDEKERNAINRLSLKKIYSSGSMLNKKIYNNAHELFEGTQILNVYGLTEAGPRVSAQRFDFHKNNSVGKPVSNVNIMIVDENGNVLPNGKKGIIHVNTLSRYSGYVTGEEKFQSLYKDWLNTGDIGYCDENNDLHITGRIDHVLFVGAHKIYPEYVAEQIVNHTNIHECVVTTVKYESTDILSCLYVASFDIDTNIKSKLCAVLMAHEIPKIFMRIKKLPKTRTGKVSMQLVKKIIAKNIEGIKNI